MTPNTTFPILTTGLSADDDDDDDDNNNTGNNNNNNNNQKKHATSKGYVNYYRVYGNDTSIVDKSKPEVLNRNIDPEFRRMKRMSEGRQVTMTKMTTPATKKACAAQFEPKENVVSITEKRRLMTLLENG